MVQEWNAETKKFEIVDWDNSPKSGTFLGGNVVQINPATNLNYPNEGAAYNPAIAGKAAGAFRITVPDDSAFTNGGPSKSPAAQICEKAASLIDGDRDKQHGDRKECHSLIAKFWGVYLARELTPVDVALMMALLKLARTKTGSFDKDHYADLVGYGAIAGELAEGGC